MVEEAGGLKSQDELTAQEARIKRWGGMVSYHYFLEPQTTNHNNLGLGLVRIYSGRRRGAQQPFQ